MTALIYSYNRIFLMLSIFGSLAVLGLLQDCGLNN